MERTSDINFEISLRRFSMYSSATALWESPGVKKEVKSYDSDDIKEKAWEIYDPRSKWGSLIKKITDFVETSILPQELKSELEDVIILVGRQLYVWLSHVIRKEVFNVKFLPNYFFTGHGTIDENLIYQVSKQDQSFPGLSNLEISRFTLYYLACCSADLKFIREKIAEIAILYIAGTGIKIKDCSKLKVNSVMTIVLISFFSGGIKLRFSQMYADVKRSNYLNGADKMFLLCVAFGKKLAAEYFFQKLEKNDMQKLLEKAAFGCLSFRSNEGMSEYQVERNAELLLYVLQKMSHKQRKEYLVREACPVYNFFVSFWPCQNLCLKLVNWVWDDLILSDQLNLLQATLIGLQTYAKNQKKVYNNIFVPVLENILMRLPEKPKLNYFRQNSFLFTFFVLSNFSCINKIMKDSDLMKRRSELLTNIDKSSLVLYLLNEGRSENIKDYMTVFKFSNEEKKKFLKFCDNPELLVNLLLNGRFDVADDVLEWQCFLNNKAVLKEKRKIQNSFDFVILCSNFIETGKTDRLENYLKWQFNGDEKEIRKVKAELYSGEFFCNLFWKKWMYSSIQIPILKFSEEHGSKILKYYLKTDADLLMFKEKLLKNPELFLKPLFDCKIPTVMSMAHVGVFKLNELLFELFSFSPDEIKQMKRKIKNNIDLWIEKYPLNILHLDALIDWITDTKKEKGSIIKNYLSSTKGVFHCYEICREDYASDSKKDIVDIARGNFIYKWVKLYGNVKKLKIEIQKINNIYPIATQHDIDAITDLLDMLNMS